MKETITEQLNELLSDPQSTNELTGQPLHDRPLIAQWFVQALREPLLHFLVLGALMFGLYFWVNGSFLSSTSPEQIDISAGTIELLKNDWRRQWQQDPTPDQLQQAIDQYIRDEILYREAISLNLNQNDLIIRRRLVQKMEFLAEDMATLREPTDEELQAYLGTHSNQYRVPAQLGFSQIYFSRELRGNQADADARKLLTKLQANPDSGKSVEKLGDRSMLSTTYMLTSISTLESLFGATFAQEMATVTQTGWQGPFHSAYGTHLVNVTELLPGHPATLAEVRDAVRLDWLENQRQQRDESFYRQLRDRYTVRIASDAIEQSAVQSASKEAS